MSTTSKVTEYIALGHVAADWDQRNMSSTHRIYFDIFSYVRIFKGYWVHCRYSQRNLIFSRVLEENVVRNKIQSSPQAKTKIGIVKTKTIKTKTFGIGACINQVPTIIGHYKWVLKSMFFWPRCKQTNERIFFIWPSLQSREYLFGWTTVIGNISQSKHWSRIKK